MKQLKSLKTSIIAIMSIQGLFLFAILTRVMNTDDPVSEKFFWILALGGFLPMLSLLLKVKKSQKELKK